MYIKLLYGRRIIFSQRCYLEICTLQLSIKFDYFCYRASYELGYSALWIFPFDYHRTKFARTANLTLPDTHDWDCDFGTTLLTVNVNGTEQKVVIGHNKRDDIMAMNTTTGKPIWWRNVAVTYRDWAIPKPEGSGVVWPGTQNGVEAYVANDNSTVYAAASNTGVIYYTDENYSGHVVPAFDAMPNGIGNGSIMALDANTGQALCEFNVGAPVGIGGPSIGNGLLLVPTGSPAEVPANPGGYIVAFGLPAK